MFEKTVVVSQCLQGPARRTYEIKLFEESSYLPEIGQTLLFKLSRIEHANFDGQKFFKLTPKTNIKIFRSYELIELKANDPPMLIFSEDEIETRIPSRKFTFQDVSMSSALEKVEIFHNRFVSFVTDESKQGMTASVKNVFDLYDPHGKFVVKIFDFDSELKESLVTSNSEIEVLRRLEHTNIIKFYDYFEGPRKRMLVLEHMDGNVVDLVNSSDKPFTESNAKFAMKQILSGLSYMHQHNITHDDLKLDNILYKSISNGENLYKVKYQNHNFS